MTSVLKDIYDGVIGSTNPKRFTEILCQFFGGEAKLQSDAETYLWTLEGVGTWKVSKNTTGSFGHIPLRIVEDPIVVISKIQGVFHGFIKGADHWRILEFLAGGSIVGYVHLARRTGLEA